MRILFCKVAAMKYYKGVCDKDQPFNGGSFVKKTGTCMEDRNFWPVETDDGIYCFGFVETKTTSKNRAFANDLHIEKIAGCEAMKDEESVDDVIIVWCATTDQNETSVMGWYKHAVVYRQYQGLDIKGDKDEHYYNVLAHEKDCVLLPRETRHKHIWNVPVAKKQGFGFGQSMLWYGGEENAQKYICNLIRNIDDYQDVNWLYEFPTE